MDENSDRLWLTNGPKTSKPLTQISRSRQSTGDVFRLSGRYPQSALHHACHRVTEQCRRAIRKRKVSPTDESVKKVVWLAIKSASQKWTNAAFLPVAHAFRQTVTLFSPVKRL